MPGTPETEITVGGPAEVRGEVRLVGRRRAHLEREDGVGLAREHQLAHGLDRLPPALERHEVLELVKVGLEVRGVDAVAAVHAAPGRGVRGELVSGLVVELHVARVGHPPAGRRLRVRRARAEASLGSQKNEKWRWPEKSSSQPREDVVEVPVLDPLAQAVGVGDLEREARHDSQHPDRDLRGAQQLGARLVDLDDLALAGHEPAGPQRRREARELVARAVRAGRDRSRDRLRVDVSLVGEREPGLPERIAELSHGRAGQRRGQAARGVDGGDAAQAAHLEHGALASRRPA